MKIDITSMFFNSKIEGQTATAAWGTSIGQNKSKECRIDDFKPEIVDMIVGMTYKCVSQSDKLDVSKGSSDREILISSVFTDIYVNDVKIENSQYVLLLIREHSKSHDGRLIISYAPYIKYGDKANSECINLMQSALGCTPNGCWFVYDISIKNQSQLHFKAVVVNATAPMNYESNVTSRERSDQWKGLIPQTDNIVVRSFDEFLLQQIYYGAPGTGKSHEIKEQTAEAEEQGRVFRTTFHPDSDYSTFVGCYKPTIAQKAVRNVAGDVVKRDGKEVFEDYISYQFVPQAFTNAYVKAWQTDEPVFLIIEEINRGNCAQIFGDLFQLLDRGDDGVSDYPIKADSDLCKYLEKELGEGHDGIKDGKIRLPRNLHIWATMNTSDQSLFPIDSAFKRRWDWHYTPICNAKKGWKVEANGNQYDWWDFLQKINERIERATSSEDKQLGYFFCKPDGNGVISAEKFVSKVIFYLWNDVFKDFADSSDDPFKVADGNRMTFRSFYIADENGKTIVNEDNVEALLGSIGVVSTFIDIDEADELENSNGAKGFLINGEVEKYKTNVPFKAVNLYVENNPDLSASEIVSIWNTLKMKGQYVYTSEEYEQKKSVSNDVKFSIRYNPLLLKNGEKIYIWNQMIPERINDFIEKVNAQSWGIHIEPVA